jgi:hypothetical protein
MGAHYTPEEDKYILDHYKGMTLSAIALALGRTANSIYSRKQILTQTIPAESGSARYLGKVRVIPESELPPRRQERPDRSAPTRVSREPVNPIVEAVPTMRVGTALLEDIPATRVDRLMAEISSLSIADYMELNRRMADLSGNIIRSRFHAAERGA